MGEKKTPCISAAGEASQSSWRDLCLQKNIQEEGVSRAWQRDIRIGHSERPLKAVKALPERSDPGGSEERANRVVGAAERTTVEPRLQL